MKIKLKIQASDLQIVFTILGSSLKDLTLEELRESPGNYCVAASLFEVFEKVQGKYSDYKKFPCKPTKEVGITLSRPQALAFDAVLNPHNENTLFPLQQGTYEWDLVRRICEQIYHTYYGT